MKFSVIGLIALGLIAAFSAAILMAVLGGPQRLVSEQPTEVTVLIATDDMPSVTIIDQSRFESRTIPVDEAPPGYLSNPVQVLGRALTRPVVAGQPLTSDCFAANQRGIDLVAMLKEGKRAVTVELTHAAGLEGLLYPGSVVDVLATFEVRQRGGGMSEDMAVSTTLLHGVEVLAIDTDTVGSTPHADVSDTPTGKLNKTRRVTLLVDTDQAKALQLAAEHGTVSLAMRNPLDKTAGNEDPTLLSGGRLAGLAAYLEGSVPRPHHMTSAPVGEALAPPTQNLTQPEAVVAVEAPHPSPAQRGPQRWDVTILRGAEVEVREMTQEEKPTATLAVDQR